MDDPLSDKKVIGILVELDPDYPCWPLGVANALSMIVGVKAVTYLYEGDVLADAAQQRWVENAALLERTPPETGTPDENISAEKEPDQGV
jgi:hypothetical protein